VIGVIPTRHVALTSMAASRCKKTPVPKAGFGRDLVKTLERNFRSRKFDVRELAASLSLSERQLQRKARELIGKAPAQILRDFRLDRSVPLLQRGHPVGETSVAVGFASHTYFTCCFKRRFGRLPSEWRSRS
jgi:AraC-like DNA-binding protein